MLKMVLRYMTLDRRFNMLNQDDDPTIPVVLGTICKRPSCGKKYVDDATSRDEGPEAECIHHSGTPVFHEGSKGKNNIE